MLIISNWCEYSKWICLHCHTVYWILHGLKFIRIPGRRRQFGKSCIVRNRKTRNFPCFCTQCLDLFSIPWTSFVLQWVRGLCQRVRSKNPRCRSNVEPLAVRIRWVVSFFCSNFRNFFNSFLLGRISSLTMEICLRGETRFIGSIEFAVTKSYSSCSSHWLDP